MWSLHRCKQLHLACATQDKNRHLYGFDSFKGVSKPTTEDVVHADHLFKWKENDMVTNKSATEKNLRTFGEWVTFFKGWIPSRFSEVEEKSFCLVHIDVDLYSLTKASIEFFYEKLNSVGLIICDDYGSEICPLNILKEGVCGSMRFHCEIAP